MAVLTRSTRWWIGARACAANLATELMDWTMTNTYASPGGRARTIRQPIWNLTGSLLAKPIR
eukprot:2649904-Rhodomonas_salina.1